jgi:hypothetical protein
MNIEDMKRESKIESARNKITKDIYIKLGLNDMYYLGQLNVLENLIKATHKEDYPDKKCYYELVKTFVTSGDASDNVKNYAQLILDIYAE